MSEKISIYTEGGMVGGAWTHQIEVEKNNEEIKTTISLSETEPETFTEKGGDLFSYLVELLSSNDLNLHVGYELLVETEKGSSFFIEGLDGWKKNFILFCYGWDEDKQVSNGDFFENLEEKILQQIFSKLNNMDDVKNLAYEIENLNEEFSILRQLNMELIDLKLVEKSKYYFPYTLEKIANFFKFNSDNYILEYEKLINSIQSIFENKVNELNRLKDSDLGQFDNLLKESDYEEKKTGSPIRGPSLDLRNRAEKIVIKRFIKEFYETEKVLPYGQHKIEDTFFNVSSKDGGIVTYDISLTITFPTPKKIQEELEDAHKKKVEHEKYLSSFNKYLENVEYEKPHSMSAVAASISNFISRKSILYFVEYYIRLNNKPPKGEFFISKFNYKENYKIKKYEDFKDRETHRIFFK